MRSTGNVAKVKTLDKLKNFSDYLMTIYIYCIYSKSLSSLTNACDPICIKIVNCRYQIFSNILTFTRNLSFRTEDKEVKVAPEPHNDTPIITPALPPSPIPSPSTPSSAFTFSSSTAVGLSMFGGISEGEHLLPDDVISDENYSEGDMRPVMMALAAVENIVTDFTSGKLSFFVMVNNKLAISPLKYDECF